MDKESFSQRALRWWREHFPTEPDAAAGFEPIVREQFQLSGLRLLIAPADVQWQTEAFDNALPFAEVVSRLLRNFLYGAESSTSLRDVAVLTGRLAESDPPEDLSGLLDQGALYLFSPDYLDHIERGELPFHRPDYTRRISNYWIFGLLVPPLAPWEFIGFVHRRDPHDVYHTGYRSDQQPAEEGSAET